MVCGLVEADGGDVTLDGESIVDMPMYMRARKGIGYLPQEASVFRKLTVRENLLAIFETLNMPTEQMHEELDALLADFGLEEVQEQKAYTLSGGQRRRTEIARCLVTKPKFVLLDEPFAGVDPIAVEDIQGIISDLRDKGYGFEQGEENKIFDLFYQGWASKEFNVQGNGLGLSIVKDIIDAHAGTIEVDLNYHGGAKFIIILPLELS